MKNYFITGTDTHVGKTLVAAILMRALQKSYWKPIQSGDSDYDAVRQLTTLSDDFFFPPTYSFKAALSPDQAAALENRSIDLQHCILPQSIHGLLVEGAGGVFVPLNQQDTMLDLMKKFNFPIVIVSRGTLGTINHTLLTIEVLRYHGLTIHGVIFSGELNPNNQTTIEKRGNIRTLFHVPFFQEISSTRLYDWIHGNYKIIMESFL